MSFKPQHNIGPARPHYIRVDMDDWARVEVIAKEIKETPAEVIRQAIRYALENMEN